MFADDWIEFPENDDHRPFEERGWVKRLREREAAIERFERVCPRAMERLGRAVALMQQQQAIKMLSGA